ncbi:MAG: GGDEF domain-containing protein [Alphaproteobacteria bacterium]|nr:GGDEF domain-containing protein [Alphaproteobacteria bacterium]
MGLGLKNFSELRFVAAARNWASRISQQDLNDAYLKNAALQAELEGVREELLLTKQQKEAAEKLAYTDALTGLPNRRAFEDKIHSLASLAQRHNWDVNNGTHVNDEEVEKAIVVISFDLDHFKSINDVYGHDTGDEALKLAAAVARKVFHRGDDMVARLGGEEFAVIYEVEAEKALRSAKQMADNLYDAINRECHLNVNPLMNDATNITQHDINEKYLSSDTSRVIRKITASIGVTLFTPSGEGSAKEIVAEVMRRADQATYDAKNNGRNCIRFIDAPWNIIARRPYDPPAAANAASATA